MADAGLGALLLRTAVSLGVVLAIVAVAYLYLKRRNTMGGAVATRRTTRRRPTSGIEVVGRVGLTRANAAVAIRFGDRVVLVATAEQGSTSVLTEMPAEQWDELTSVREQIPHSFAAHQAAVAASEDAPRPGFVEALRQATARHG